VRFATRPTDKLLALTPNNQTGVKANRYWEFGGFARVPDRQRRRMECASVNAGLYCWNAGNVKKISNAQLALVGLVDRL
jgi:hypothetical protein